MPHIEAAALMWSAEAKLPRGGAVRRAARRNVLLRGSDAAIDCIEEGESLTRMTDWSERYRTLDTPWNLGGPHPELVRKLENCELDPREGFRKALVAGCGHGHDSLALARAGFSVTAVDIVSDLRDHLEGKLAALGGRFVIADALALEGETFDFVFDHTFFCAIDPSMRAEWGAMIRRVLRPGGVLASIVYPFSKPVEAGGPPWGMSRDAIEAALGAGFEMLADEDVVERGHQTWPERWLVMRRV